MKKKNVGIIASLIAMSSKVFGAPQILYGPPRGYMLESWLKVAQISSAPILFLIGLVIYTKNKNSQKRKIITIIIFVLLLIGVYYGLELLLDRLMW